MEQRVADLEDELVQLRADLRNCRLEVARLRRLVEGGGESVTGESGLAGSVASGLSGCLGNFSGVESYSVVPGQAASAAAATGVSVQASSAPVPQPWSERERPSAWVLGIGCFAAWPLGLVVHQPGARQQSVTGGQARLALLWACLASERREWWLKLLALPLLSDGGVGCYGW